MIYPIVNSIYTWLNNLTSLNIYVYFDSSLDISKTINCSPTSNVSDTQTAFVIKNNGTGSILTGETNTLKNRYALIYNSDTFLEEYSRITSYDSTTGEIILEDSYELTTTDTFDIVFKDTLFIETGRAFQTYRKINNTITANMVYMNLQTKDDSKKENIMDYMYIIEKDFMQKRKKLPIYNNSSEVCGYMKSNDSIMKEPKGDFSNQIQKYLMSFGVEYVQDFEK